VIIYRLINIYIISTVINLTILLYVQPCKINLKILLWNVLAAPAATVAWAVGFMVILISGIFGTWENWEE